MTKSAILIISTMSALTFSTAAFAEVNIINNGTVITKGAPQVQVIEGPVYRDDRIFVDRSTNHFHEYDRSTVNNDYRPGRH